MDEQMRPQPPQHGLSGMMIFTQSATWHVPKGVVAVRAMIFGSGGGGGGGSLYSNQGNIVFGGQGGSGGFFYGVIPVVQDSDMPVTVGTGGAGAQRGGVNMGNPSAGENGQDGTPTIFGSVAVQGGKGGTGGVWGQGGYAHNPGAGLGGHGGSLQTSGGLSENAYIFLQGKDGMSGQSSYFNFRFPERKEDDNHFIFRNWNSARLNYSLTYCLGGNGGAGSGTDGAGNKGMDGLIIIEY